MRETEEKMSEIQRICVQCGQAGPLDARYCPACGYDSQAALPAMRSNLPALVGKAAVPVLVGAASLAARAGWKLLHSRWARETARNAIQSAVQRIASSPPPATPAPAPQPPSPAARRPRRTIHIRSSWAVADANGVWRRGQSEHTIDLED